jgi:deoxyribonuclease V
VDPAGWPSTVDELVAVQDALRADAAAAPAWRLDEGVRFGGCFVAYARGEQGPGHPGDRAWAAAVVWRPTSGEPRRGDDLLRGVAVGDRPRRAADVTDQAVVADRVPAAYARGLLALREGPILAAAVNALTSAPDVLLVDATGLDHPRRAGLAVHLGAVIGVPTVGVTHRALLATGNFPPLTRRAVTDVTIDGDVVGRWVCTRTGVRPVLAHAAWRTDAATAAAVVLAASTEGGRAPVPLQEARRVAREARAIAGAD